jgi:hypothetical protein
MFEVGQKVGAPDRGFSRKPRERKVSADCSLIYRGQGSRASTIEPIESVQAETMEVEVGRGGNVDCMREDVEVPLSVLG